jgi:hypothetical protein
VLYSSQKSAFRVAQVTALIDEYFEKEVEADDGLIGTVKTIPPSTRASIKVPFSVAGLRIWMTWCGMQRPSIPSLHPSRSE